jgi:hypothetical protein
LDDRVSAVSDHVQLALLRLAERRNAAVPEEQDQLGGAGGVADLDLHVAGDPEASLQVRVCLLGGFEEKSRGDQATPAPLRWLGGVLGPVYNRGGSGVSLDGVDGVLSASLALIHLGPPDETSARQVMRAEATTRLVDAKSRQFWLLLDSSAGRWNGSQVRRAKGESRSGVGRPRPSLDSRPRRSPSRLRSPARGGLSWNSGRQFFSPFSRPMERLAQAGEHRQIGVKLDALQATDAERRESVVVLQTSKLPLNSDAAKVKLTEAPRPTRNERRHAASVRGDLQNKLLRLGVSFERDDWANSEVFALAVHPIIVVAFVHRAGGRAVAARMERVEERTTYSDSFRRPVSTLHASGSPVWVQTARWSL